MAIFFPITSGIATTAGKFIDYLPIKTIRKYRNFQTLSKVIQIKIDKVSNSIYVINKGYKPICSPYLSLMQRSVSL